MGGREESGGGEHADLVAAALRAAEALGRDVADVPLTEIARQAGIARSTLLRRLGGTRGPLDEAVRAAGVDPGGRRPVRERAVAAAAALIDEHGLAAVTLEAVAIAAECSVPSVYAAFGGRTELLRVVFERYSPIVDLEKILARCDGDLRAKVLAVYRELARALLDRPRVMPAMMAELLAHPHTPDTQAMVAYHLPRVLGGVGGWLGEQIAAGRLRDLSIPLLLHQMVGPLVFHLMVRAALGPSPELDLPDLGQTCEILADAFLRATAPPSP
ncbi:transcriptional regulator [Frankia sp. EI5c]|uniref:TetR/AcrR family transcriptional regulator n=1 Tax=Frankia sp. EI5c TaxID=683316 RepID=UPI0007C3A754|nr:TetR/AcrR family transcriptional regulator [Frankia sp. EI5c]OAA18079.1 transcriptional regulator [Frankia sp. EI5c]